MLPLIRLPAPSPREDGEKAATAPPSPISALLGLAKGLLTAALSPRAGRDVRQDSEGQLSLSFQHIRPFRVPAELRGGERAEGYDLLARRPRILHRTGDEAQADALAPEGVRHAGMV